MVEKGLSPGDYLQILKMRKWSLILPATALFLLAAAVAFMLPSVYRSQATIFIEDQELPPEFVASTVTSYAEQRIQAIHERIMSFTPLLRIIQEYNLYPEMKDRYTTEEIVARMRADTLLEPINTDIVDRRTGRPATATIAFVLSYDGQDPHKVQKVVNVLVSLFLEQNIKERVQQVEETSTFLETEMAKIKKELTALETEIAAFKEVHIHELPEMLQFNLQGLNNILINLDQVDRQLSSLREREGYLQSQLASINPGLDSESRLRLEQLRIELVALTKRFSEEYPDVKKARAEIADLEEKRGYSKKTPHQRPDNPAYITLKAQLASVQAELTSTRQQKERLQAEADEYRKRIAATPAVENQYSELNGKHRSNQAKYDDLMNKLMDARVAHGMEKEQKGERFNLVEAPRLPEKPYKPNRAVIVLIGLILGIGVGIGTAVLRESMDDSVHSTGQLSEATGIPVLAVVPLIRTTRDIEQRRVRRWIMVATATLIVAVGLVVFHYQMMDLNVFWAKFLRRIAL